MPVLAAAVLFVCFFSHLGALGLVGPDEPRYAAVARAMVETGDWVTPRLYGQPWFEKPALYYWGAAAAFRILGVSESAARLPSALAAALATLALAWAAWRLYGAAAGRAVLFILPTCVGSLAFARAATQDMLFSAALAAAMLTAHAVCSPVRSENFTESSAVLRKSLLGRFAFGFFLGVATLAKGPAGIALAGGSVALWALVSRRWREAFRLAHPLAIAAFCLTALPWYLLCAARNPDFIRTFLFAHNVERYLTPIFHHEQPFWFFGGVLVLGLLPWTLLLGGVAGDAVRTWRQKRWADSPAFFFLCWGAFPVVFFSFSKSKLPGYVLPAVLPLALLLARSIARLSSETPHRAAWYFVGVGSSLIALAASAGHWLRRLPAESGMAEPGQLLAWLVLIAAGGLGVAILGLLRRPRAALVATAVLVAMVIEAANLRLLPRLDPYLSPRAAARAAQRFGATNRLAVFRLHRAWHYGLNFYFHRELPDWTPDAGGPGWVFTGTTGVAELERRGIKFEVIERTSPQALLVQILTLPELPAERAQPGDSATWPTRRRQVR